MNTTYYELPAQDKNWIKKHYPKLAGKFLSGSVSPKNMPSANTEALSIHTGCIITEQVLQQLPNLKLIVTRTVGVDHIDLAACRRAKVTVVNSPGLNAIAVAEFVFGLLLSFCRQIPGSLEIGKRMDFQATDFIGTELAGKTMGIVGTGAIGAHVAQIAKGFGMDVIGFDFKKNPSLVRKVGLRYVNMKSLFARADVITLHVPATPMTQKMVNRTLLSQAKPSTVLINTARGSIVDSEALLKALKSKKLAGYLTDVLDHELEMHTSKHQSAQNKKLKAVQKELARLVNVFITPHMAYASKEANDRILAHSMDVIDKFSKGKKVPAII